VINAIYITITDSYANEEGVALQPFWLDGVTNNLSEY